MGSGASSVVLIGAGRARIVVEDGAAMAMMPAAGHTYAPLPPAKAAPGHAASNERSGSAFGCFR